MTRSEQTRKATTQSSAVLDKVIVDSKAAQGRYDAQDGRVRSSDDPAYLAAYFETRRGAIGY